MRNALRTSPERQNPNCFDLYRYYANDRDRIITYVYMTFLEQAGGTYVEGPFIVISDTAVAVDGVTIKNAAIGAMVS